MVRSTTADQNIQTKLLMADTFYVERRNAIVKDGVVVGVTDTIAASTGDLVSGTRGIATLHTNDNQTIAVENILIGSPFPRP